MSGKLALVAALAAAAVIVPPAAAHGGGGGAAKGYHSVVQRLVPATSVIHVQVVDADDRLQLHIDDGHTLVIAGYQKEPYLRFDPTGVYINNHSPATYLNDDRFGRITLPASADAKATPDWEKVAPAGEIYEWHDHRIHWMGTNYPPLVAKDKAVAHHIFDWKVPATLDRKPVSIQGSLDYAPLPGQKFPTILIIPLLLLFGVGIGAWLLRSRRGDT